MKLLDTLLDKSIVFSFDRTGFRRHRKRFEDGDLDVDLRGRRALVTGANAGIGRATAFALARLGAEVWLLCRNEERGRQALEDLRLATGASDARLEQIDLSIRGSVLDFVDRLGNRTVDILVNNAGVLPGERTLTIDGLELTWATNVVGPFLLTAKLVPRLATSTAGGRVINVSSGGMYTQQLDLRDLTWEERDFDGVTAYAQSKRAEVVLTELWADKLPAHNPDTGGNDAGYGIDVNSMHPGWARTRSVEESLPRFYRITRPILRTPAEGADTIIWLAACERLRGMSGQFFFDRRKAPTHILDRTHEPGGDRERLWQIVSEQAGLFA